jgi:hypothetical protein
VKWVLTGVNVVGVGGEDSVDGFCVGVWCGETCWYWVVGVIGGGGGKDGRDGGRCCAYVLVGAGDSLLTWWWGYGGGATG